MFSQFFRNRHFLNPFPFSLFPWWWISIVKWMTIEFILKSRSFLYSQEWVLLFNWCCFCCTLSHPTLSLSPLLWFTVGRSGGGGLGCSSWSSVLIFGVNGVLFGGSHGPFPPIFFPNLQSCCLCRAAWWLVCWIWSWAAPQWRPCASSVYLLWFQL